MGWPPQSPFKRLHSAACQRDHGAPRSAFPNTPGRSCRVAVSHLARHCPSRISARRGIRRARPASRERVRATAKRWPACWSRDPDGPPRHVDVSSRPPRSTPSRGSGHGRDAFGDRSCADIDWDPRPIDPPVSSASSSRPGRDTRTSPTLRPSAHRPSHPAEFTGPQSEWASVLGHGSPWVLGVGTRLSGGDAGARLARDAEVAQRAQGAELRQDVLRARGDSHRRSGSWSGALGQPGTDEDPVYVAHAGPTTSFSMSLRRPHARDRVCPRSTGRKTSR